jgi:hypothetical protein
VPSKRPKRIRAQEQPARPEPPTTPNERIRSVFQALNGAAHAHAEFCASPNADLRQIAFRNFLSNAASVTFLMHGLRHDDRPRWLAWWKPYEERLKAEPLFRFFYLLRTDSMKRATPKLIWLAPVDVTEEISVTQIRYADPDGPEEGRTALLGTTPDGREVSVPSGPGHWTAKGMPSMYTLHPLGVLMQRYLTELERIATETMAEFWTEEADDDSEMRDLFTRDWLGLHDPGE